jgi:holo-[acyl-carrier protein] synthase
MIEIKKIVATFIAKEPSEIFSETVIDKTAVKGSILIHRMYGAIANKGYKIKDYQKIKTFGDLVNAIDAGSVAQNVPVINTELNNIKGDANRNTGIRGIGIDIEEIENLPVVDDFRNDEFYLKNFTSSEITYCILKQNPLQSFAGLFCIKEAIFKADATLQQVEFNKIEISHNENGSPYVKGYLISLSHTDTVAVGVAIAL